MTDEDKPYGVARGSPGQNPMLDIRLKAGSHFALAYNYLVAIQFNGADEIKLYFTSHHVLIKGGNLSALYTGLMLQAVEFVQETPRPSGHLTADKPFINTVEVQEV